MGWLKSVCWPYLMKTNGCHMDHILTIQDDVLTTSEDEHQTPEPPQAAASTASDCWHSFSTSCAQVLWQALAGALSVSLLLLNAALALLLAALWLLTGAHVVARHVLLRKDILQPDKRRHRGLMHTALIVYASWYAILLTTMWKVLLRHIIRPAFVFLVYGEDEVLMTRMLSDVMYYGLGLAQLPAVDVCPIGLILSDVGMGMCASMLPCLQDLDHEQTMGIPARLKMAFPYTRAFALAGRLPGVLARLKHRPCRRPLWMVYMALSSPCRPQAHTKRPLQDTCICVLGGNGFIGSRLVELLTQHAPVAAAEPSSTSSVQAYEHSGHLPNAQSIPYGEHLEKRQLKQEQLEKQSNGYRLVMSMDPRNTTRTLANGVLYTSDPADITAADIVLVITASGNDCAPYLPYARAGQVWGDDTHPEMGRKVVQSLCSKGVMLYKVYNVGGVGARFVPRLPGFPANSIPGCLLMALTQVECGAVVGGWPYEQFRDVADGLGFSAALGQHKPWFE